MGAPTAKMEIWNVQEATSIQVQFNPRKLPEKIQAHFTRHTVPGMSHEPLQYSHTGNQQFTLELVFAVRSEQDRLDISHARRFLLSLLYPWRGHTAPPRALLVWPGLVDLTVFVLDFDGGHEHFDPDLNTIWYTCKLTVEEVRDARLYGDDVLRDGTMRGTGAAPAR
jgi:hypothetical protein